MFSIRFFSLLIIIVHGRTPFWRFMNHFGYGTHIYFRSIAKEIALVIWSRASPSRLPWHGVYSLWIISSTQNLDQVQQKVGGHEFEIPRLARGVIARWAFIGTNLFSNFEFVLILNTVCYACVKQGKKKKKKKKSIITFLPARTPNATSNVTCVYGIWECSCVHYVVQNHFAMHCLCWLLTADDTEIAAWHNLLYILFITLPLLQSTLVS